MSRIHRPVKSVHLISWLVLAKVQAVRKPWRKIMKLLILFALLLLTVPVMAQSQSLPICLDDTEAPCLASEHDKSSLLTTMLMHNADGLKAVNARARAGFETEATLVTLVTQKFIDHPIASESKITLELRYEMLLSDCRGTDECGGEYLWTVTENVLGDGYSSMSTFTDSVKRLGSGCSFGDANTDASMIECARKAPEFRTHTDESRR